VIAAAASGAGARRAWKPSADRGIGADTTSKQSSLQSPRSAQHYLARRPIQVDPLRTVDYGTSTKWPEMVRVLD
jgi:hypothetical protein